MVSLVFVILCLIWGSTWLIIRIGLDDSPPLWSAGFRFLLAAVVLLIINKIQGIKYPEKPVELWRAAFPGIFMYGVGYPLVYMAEQHITSALTAVLFSSLPIFVALFSYRYLKNEKLDWFGWLGLITGFTGIIFVFYDALKDSRIILGAAAMVVLSAVVSAYSTVYIRAKLTEYRPQTLVALQTSLGAVLILVTALIFEPLGDFKITYRSVGAVIYLGLLGTIAAFTLYYWLLKRMKAISVAQTTFIIPLIAILMGYIFRNETISSFALIGTVLIIGGVIVVIRRPRK